MVFNSLKSKRNPFYIRKQRVPRSKHSPPRLYKTYLLLSCTVRVALCSQIRTQHIKSKAVTMYTVLNVQPVVSRYTD